MQNFNLNDLMVRGLGAGGASRPKNDTANVSDALGFDRVDWTFVDSVMAGKNAGVLTIQPAQKVEASALQSDGAVLHDIGGCPHCSAAGDRRTGLGGIDGSLAGSELLEGNVPAEISVSETPLDAIDWVNANNVPFVDGVAYVYFGDSDENFGQTADDGITPMVTIDWNDFEKQQIMLALEEFEKILGVEYEITEDLGAATFRLLKTESQQYGAYFFPQDPSFGANQGVGVFNVLSGGWGLGQQETLNKGGFSFAVILHEFGHAHGLAHPHDLGGGSNRMLGVNGINDYGDNNLNQGVFTVMSYNDAWELHPDGPTPFTVAGIANGWSGTLAAFDIAVLQERYGIQNPTAAGNTVYELSGVQATGTYYETIWDTGGNDAIVFNGDAAVKIDLNAATLDYSPTGGGTVSFVDNIKGGYTIAAGVVIERAIGGNGDDLLIGNAAANSLRGNGGLDTMFGGQGNDTLIGDDGDDLIDGGDDDDQVKGGLGNDEILGLLGNDKLLGQAGNDTIDGGDGDDRLTGNDGEDSLFGGIGADTLFGGDQNDRLEGGGNGDTLSGAGGDDSLVGGNGDDLLNGGNGRDTIEGGGGADSIFAGKGADMLIGGNGPDVFRFQDNTQFDTITDYEIGFDSINLRSYREENGGKIAFDQLLITQNGDDTRIELDLDRNGIADVIDLDGNGSTDPWRIDLLDIDATTITTADFVL